VGDYFTSCPQPGAEKSAICKSFARATTSNGFNFDSIRRYFLWRAQDFLLFDACTAAGASPGDDLGGHLRDDLGDDWATTGRRRLGDDLGGYLDENVGRDLAREPEHRDGTPERAGADARERLPVTPRREEDERANPLGLVITAAMLFVLFAAAMLFGTHGTIGSIPHRASSTTPGAKTMGNLLYGAQGVASCPQMSFDNATGSIAKSTERCLGRDGDAAGHPHD
jgi:hypothetical protein